MLSTLRILTYGARCSAGLGHVKPDISIDVHCLVSDGLALSSRDAASVTSTDLERLDAAPGRNIVSPEAAAPPLRDCRDRSRSPNGESETPEERCLRARTSLGHKVEWSTYIKPFAESLNKLFIEDWKVTKKWDFKCELCPKAGKAGIHVDKHIRGDPHRRMLLKERKCDQPTWLQSFELISGCHKFHHLTGELTLGAVTTLEPSLKMPKDEGSKQCVGEASTESAKRSKIDETSCAIEEPSDLCVAVKDAKAKYENKKVQDAIQDAKVKEYLSEEFVARLPNPGEVPPFDPFARGGPLNWNKQHQLYWGKRTKEYLSRIPTLASDIAESHVRVRELLHERFGPDGRPIFEQLVYDTHDKTGWYRYRWAPFEDAGGKEALPKSSLGKHGHQGQADWQRAWHGCKFEALYSIMYHGRLFESGDAERGERFFSNAPGVYVHKDETCAKTGNYFRFVPLCRDGVFWAALWEVQVDRSDRVPPKNGTDQWVQHERSVKLAALWLIGCTYEHMHSGCAVSLAWDPFLEADPKRDRTRRRKRSVEAKNPQISNALEDALGIPPAGTCSINKLGTD